MATPEVTAEPQRTLPTAAGGTSLTPSSSAWANSAYGEMSASIGSAITIVGVAVNAGIAAEFEIDIARGAATSEVVVATFIGHVESLGGLGNHVFFCYIPIDDIASGQRIACRLRKSGTDTTAWTVKLVYYNSVSATVGVTANESLVAPSAAAGVSLTPSGSAWVNSAWGELSASLTDIAVLGVAVNPGVGATEFEIDVGAGAATSEVVVGTTGANAESLSAYWTLLPFRIPIQVAGTNRLTTRLRKSSTDISAWTVKLLYISTSGFGTSAVQSTTQPQKIQPSATGLSSNSGSTTAWANSAWRQEIASTGAGLVVVGRGQGQHSGVGAFPEYEIDMGTGAATSEVVIASDADNVETDAVQLSPAQYVIPVDNIPASTRVSFRHRDADTAASTFTTGLVYYEKPL